MTKVPSQDIPLLIISNTERNIFKTIPPSYASWLYKTEEGLFQHISIQSTNQTTDIRKSSIPRIEMPILSSKIKINFSYEPITYSVQCWPEAPHGFKKVYYSSDISFLEVNNHTISLSLEEPAYIIQIKGIWTEGEVNYTFSISELISNI